MNLYVEKRVVKTGNNIKRNENAIMKILVRKAVVEKNYKVDFFFPLPPILKFRETCSWVTQGQGISIFPLHLYLCATPAESNLFEKETEIQRAQEQGGNGERNSWKKE